MSFSLPRGDSLNDLVRSRMNHEVLDRDTEQDLISKAQAGCRASLDALFMGNMRMLRKFAQNAARALNGGSFKIDDCFSLAAIGLQRAIEDYRPGRSRLYAYAYYKMWKEVFGYADRHNRTIRLPKEVRLLRKRLMNDPQEIGKIKVEGKAERILKAPYEPDSFEKPIPGSDGLTIGDTVADVDAPTPFECAARLRDIRAVRRVLGEMSEAQRLVIVLTHFEGRTIADIIPLLPPEWRSREKCSRLHRIALRRLERALRRDIDQE